MRYFFLIALLCSIAAAQAPAPSKTDARPAPARNSKNAKAAQPRPDEGSVTTGTYAEKFFNLSCTIPEGWVVKTAAMREGLSGQEDSILLLSAFAKDAPTAGQINSSLTITAESLTALPDVKTPADYFAGLSAVVTGKGFTVLNEPAEIDIGGVVFLRGDFQKQDGNITTYQATMVAIHKGYVLGITAISGDEDDLTPLLNRIHIFAPPTLKKP